MTAHAAAAARVSEELSQRELHCSLDTLEWPSCAGYNHRSTTAPRTMLAEPRFDLPQTGGITSNGASGQWVAPLTVQAC